MLIKYIKSVLWRVAKRLSYIEDARCLKVKGDTVTETNLYYKSIICFYNRHSLASGILRCIFY